MIPLAPSDPVMVVTLQIVPVANRDGRDLIRCLGFMPSGQLLIQGAIREGSDLTAYACAYQEISNWVRDNRPGWTIEIGGAS